MGLPARGGTGETGATLTESEMNDLRQLAELPAETLDVMLLAADELCTTALPIGLPVEVRRSLLERFGMFGLRVVVDRLRGNPSVGAAAMAPALVDMSGLPNVVRTLRESFLPRTGTLKSRAGLMELRRVAATLTARQPHVPDLRANAHGSGRELFGLFRRACGSAEEGASPLFG